MQRQKYKIIVHKSVKNFNKKSLGKKAFNECLKAIEDFAVNGLASKCYQGWHHQEESLYLKVNSSKYRVNFEYNNNFIKATIFNGSFEGEFIITKLRHKN